MYNLITPLKLWLAPYFSRSPSLSLISNLSSLDQKERQQNIWCSIYTILIIPHVHFTSLVLSLSVSAHTHPTPNSQDNQFFHRRPGLWFRRLPHPSPARIAVSSLFNLFWKAVWGGVTHKLLRQPSSCWKLIPGCDIVLIAILSPDAATQTNLVFGGLRANAASR